MKSVHSGPQGSLPGRLGQYFLSHLEGGAMGNEVSSFPRENELTRVPRCGTNYVKIWVGDIKMPRERKCWPVTVFGRNSSKVDLGSCVL